VLQCYDHECTIYSLVGATTIVYRHSWWDSFICCGEAKPLPWAHFFTVSIGFQQGTNRSHLDPHRWWTYFIQDKNVNPNCATTSRQWKAIKSCTQECLCALQRHRCHQGPFSWAIHWQRHENPPFIMSIHLRAQLLQESLSRTYYLAVANWEGWVITKSWLVNSKSVGLAHFTPKVLTVPYTVTLKVGATCVMCWLLQIFRIGHSRWYVLFLNLCRALTASTTDGRKRNNREETPHAKPRC